MIVSKTTVNRWLPGSIEMFTPEFFKMPKDLPKGRSTTLRTHSAWLTFLLDNTLSPLASWRTRPPSCGWESKGGLTTAGIR